MVVFYCKKVTPCREREGGSVCRGILLEFDSIEHYSCVIVFLWFAMIDATAKTVATQFLFEEKDLIN